MHFVVPIRVTEIRDAIAIKVIAFVHWRCQHASRNKKQNAQKTYIHNERGKNGPAKDWPSQNERDDDDERAAIQINSPTKLPTEAYSHLLMLPAGGMMAFGRSKNRRYQARSQSFLQG